jgi:LPS sulfotransferase NodH
VAEDAINAKECKMDQRSYVVASTERSGSSLLCEALTLTGVAGYPWSDLRWATFATRLITTHNEWLAWLVTRRFTDVRDTELLARAMQLPPRRPERFDLQRVIRGASTPNGVCGLKLHWPDWVDFAGFMQRPANASLMRALTPRLRCVWIRREDKLAQAISLTKAYQTGVFDHDNVPVLGASAVFDFDMIDHLRSDLEAQDAAWGRWFDQHRVTPHVVVYERLTADLEGTVAGVLEYLEIPGSLTQPPTHRRLADAVSAQWRQQYLDERRHRGAS